MLGLAFRFKILSIISVSIDETRTSEIARGGGFISQKPVHFYTYTYIHISSVIHISMSRKLNPKVIHH